MSEKSWPVQKREGVVRNCYVPMLNLTDDVLLKIGSMLGLRDFSAWRLVTRSRWTLAHVREVAVRRIARLSVATMYTCTRRGCAVVGCPEACVTFAVFDDGRVRAWLPYCELHLNPEIAQAMEVYVTK